MSSIALWLPARRRSATRRLQTVTLRKPWLRRLLAFADPAASPGVRRDALVRYAAAAIALSLFGGSLAGVASALTEEEVMRGPTGPSSGPAAAAVPPMGGRIVEAGTAAEVTSPEPAPYTEAAAVAPARRLPLPSGKGMWLWQPEAVEGADPHAIVAKARAHNLTHLFVRTGSSWQGFHGAAFLDRLLPVAHEAGLRIYGWDFPNLADPGVDLARSVTAIRHAAPGGHRIDGFVPDIETWSEGTRLTRDGVRAYGEGLRAAVGPDYPLVVAVPRPSAQKLREFDYSLVLEPYDAVAPMVYWLNRQPDTDIHTTMSELARYGKPVLPIGQAYDGAPEGGRPGPPSADEIRRFMRTAERHGAVSVSFWSWQHADTEVWSAIRDAPEFRLRPAHPGDLRPGEVKSIHHLLRGLGYPVRLSSKWGDATSHALKELQRDRGLPTTGRFDRETRRAILRPAHLVVPRAQVAPKASTQIRNGNGEGTAASPAGRTGRKIRPTVVRLPRG